MVAKKKVEKVPMMGVMPTICVQHDVPKPPKAARSMYPWAEMVKTGDMFFLPGRTMKQTSGLYAAARKAGMKIEIRRFELKGVEGIGVWRA